MIIILKQYTEFTVIIIFLMKLTMISCVHSILLLFRWILLECLPFKLLRLIKIICLFYSISPFYLDILVHSVDADN